jgi:CHAD domain-containing protein
MPLSPAAKWIDIRPDDTVCHAARLSLEPRLMAVVHHLPRAAYHYEQDVEHVHRLRVSTRRAMAALELYRELLPQKRRRWLRKQLKKVRRAAGEARDLDVLRERIHADHGDRAAKVVELIATKRAAVQPAIVTIAERFRRKEKFLRRTVDLLEAIGDKNPLCQESNNSCFRDWAARQLATSTQQFLTALPSHETDLAALHQFRIRAKALRYSIELMSSAFGNELRETHYRTIEELQERLGKINDHVAARDRLRDWAAGISDNQLRDMLCQLAEEETARLTDELSSWHDWWSTERIEQARRGLMFAEHNRSHAG